MHIEHVWEKREMAMSDEALIAYIAGRLEALLSHTGMDDSVSSMSCDLRMFQTECDKLREICLRQLKRGERQE